MRCPFVIKVCKKCKRILVANSNNFDRYKKGKYKVVAVCKECKSKYNKNNYQLSKKLVKEGNSFDNIDINKVWNHCPFCIKVCTKCNEILVANELNFNKSKSEKYNLRSSCKKCHKKYREESKERIKEYYENNKDELNKKKKIYYKNNKVKLSKNKKEYMKIYRETHKNYIKLYREEHKEELKKYMEKYNKQYYKEHEKELKEYQKEYRENNPNKVFNYCTKRRLKEESQGNGITKEQWYEMMMFFDFRCAYSGEYIGGDSKNRTIDHITPLDKGGLNEIWNCVPCYSIYNFQKSTKDMLEWYTQQEFYSEDRLMKIYEWQAYAFKKWVGYDD